MTISLRVARAFLGQQVAPSAPLSREQLLELRREGLLGLHLCQCADHPQVRRGYLQMVGREGRMRSLMQELDRELTLPAVVFKGGAYLGSLYPRLGQRHVGDLDLVARHLPELERQLLQLGFVVSQRSPLILTRDGLELDLHDHPLGRQRKVFRWSLERAWEARAPLGSGALARFDLADEAVLCLLHGAKHAFSRLVWLVDLALLQRQCRTLPQGLAEAGARRYGGYGAFLLEQLLGIPGPVRPLTRAENLFLRAVLARRAPELLGMLLPLGSVSGWGARAAYLGQVLAPRAGDSWARRLGELANLALELVRFLIASG